MPRYDYVMNGKTTGSTNQPDVYVGRIIGAANHKEAAMLVLANEFGSLDDSVKSLLKSGWISKQDWDDQFASYLDSDTEFHITNGDLEFTINFRLPNDIVFPGAPDRDRAQVVLLSVLAIIDKTYVLDDAGNRTNEPSDYSAADLVSELVELEPQIKAALTP